MRCGAVILAFRCGALGIVGQAAKLKGGVGKVKRRGKRNLKDFIGYQMEVA